MIKYSIFLLFIPVLFVEPGPVFAANENEDGSIFSDDSTWINDADHETPEDLILQVKASLHLFGEVFAYSVREKTYLPLIQVAELAGFPITLGDYPELAIAEASPLMGGFTLSSDEENNLIFSNKGGAIKYDSASWLQSQSIDDGDIYLRTDIVDEILPITAKVNIRRMSLVLESEVTLPAVQKIDRAKDRDKRMSPQKNTGAASKPGLKYDNYSPPIIRINNNISYAKGKNVSGNYSIAMEHDLLGLGSQTSLLASSAKGSIQIDSLNWKGQYYASDDGVVPKILGRINSLRLGNLTLERSSINNRALGTGVEISSFKEQASIFVPQSVSDTAPPGWEADLYLNQALIDHTIVSDDGIYYFDLFLRPGKNKINVRLYGPYGEERIDRYVYNISPSHLDTGEFAYKFSASSPERNIYSTKDSDDIYGEVFESKVAYGISNGVDLSLTHVFKELIDDDVPDANIIGATIGTSIGLLGLNAESYFEKGEFLNKLGLSYETDRLSTVLLYINQNGWLDAIRNNDLVEERIDWTLNSDFDIDKQRVDASFKFIRESGHSGTENYIQFRQSASQGSTTYTFIESCEFARTRECELEVQSRFLVEGMRINLGANINRDETTEERILSAGIDSRLRNVADVLGYGNYDSYDISPWLKSFIRSSRIMVKYDVINRRNYNSSYSDRKSIEKISIDLSSSYRFSYLNAGVKLGWSKDAGIKGSLFLFGSLYPEENGKGYKASSENFSYPARVRIFGDHDYDGVYSEGDSLKEGIKLKDGFTTTVPSDESGIIWTSVSPIREMRLDYRTVDDPYMVVDRKILGLKQRKGRVTYIDLPVVDTGAVEGSLMSADGKPLGGYRLDLVRKSTGKTISTIYSAVDGFYVFEFIRPGDYRIKVHSGVKTKDVAEVKLSHDNLWPVVDIILEY